MPVNQESIFEYNYELSLKLVDDMSPELNILVFYIHKNEIIPDSASLKLNKCLKNKVKFFLKIPS